ncbi:MMPL family transporter [Nocardioides sp. HM23]|uniref:MMPL family transporter n=1 Tax=Nocardioides bizhenqiangii TaxID=3095076 RepID=UPI002AC9F7B7|nr:MMPL family transporter [Nocardioides sp. HM23]MDZ5622440.1 MMPL family transporter [Nocardioides sp. HM23]
MSSSTQDPLHRSGALAALARACAGHPVRTLVLWATTFVAVALSANLWGGELVNEFNIPGSETQSAVDLLEEKFPERAGDAAQVVFTDDQPLTTKTAHQDIEAAQQAASEVEGVVSIGDPYAGKGGGISDDGTIGFFDVQFEQPAAEIDDAVVEQLEDDVRAALDDSSLQVEFGGTVMDSVQPESHTSEIVGMIAAMIVLLIVLGSAMAMAIPITVGVVSVGLGMSLLTLAAAYTDFNEVTPILAVMIGLGVGIDYALFILTRFRSALADGETPKQAAVTATSTAGRAVLFAGLTVAVSISGLAVVGIPFVTKLGLGAAMTVVGAVVTAVTLLPALLAVIGHRVDWGRLPSRRSKKTSAPQTSTPRAGAFDRWGGFVSKHPKSLAVGALAVVFLLAVPAADQRLGTADAGTNPKDTTTRQAYDLLAEGFGPGFNGPLLVAVDQTDDPQAAAKVATAISEDSGVAAVATTLVNEAGDTAQVPVILTSSPQSEETAETLDRLRSEVIPEALEGSSAQAYVGGATASYEDIASKIGDRMGWFLFYIVGITFLILTMAFRSIVVAGKAALTTLLSAAAAFGAMTAVFEWGWLGEQIGLDVTGPTESFIPMIVLSILFGLSMDYEVFLVSRIREEYIRTGDARGSVRTGVGAIGKVIVAAGLIMGSVFWAFVIGDDRTVKAFGVGLGVAILVDALLVRMVLVPAVMHLLGRRAWYIPRWLDRALPALTIEPPEHDESAPEKSQTDEDDTVPVG